MDSNELGTDAGISEVVPTTVPPGYISKEEANRIVHERTKATAEKVRQQTLAEFGGVRPQATPTEPVDVQAIENRVIQRINTDIQQKQAEYDEKNRQENAQKFSANYFGKLTDKSVKERYADDDEVLGNFNHAAYLPLIELAQGEPNTADLMYHLAQDPIKAAQFNVTAAQDKAGALKALRKLSKSISDDLEAKQLVKKAQPPLSRVASSNVGADNVPRNVSDWKAHKLCRW